MTTTNQTAATKQPDKEQQAEYRDYMIRSHYSASISACDCPMFYRSGR